MIPHKFLNLDGYIKPTLGRCRLYTVFRLALRRAQPPLLRPAGGQCLPAPFWVSVLSLAPVGGIGEDPRVWLLAGISQTPFFRFFLFMEFPPLRCVPVAGAA